MTYKTVLLHCDGDKPASRRAEIAAGIARRFSSHLVGLHVQPPFVPSAFDQTGFAMEPLFGAYEEAAQTDREGASASFTAAIKGQGLSTEWRTAEAVIDEQLTVQARYADLIVVGQANPDLGSLVSPPMDLPEAVALSSGRPTLVVPYVGAARQPGSNILLCWNARREAARAASDALPLLKQAQNVEVLVVDGEASPTGHGTEPGADVATWLSRHGVKVTVKRETAADAEVGEAILSRAATVGSDLIVMGLYGHSRAREFILGGASRTLLASMTVPVLMAH